MAVPGFTDTHPVAHSIECTACQAAVSGDDVTDLVIAMFRSLHQGPEHPVTETRGEQP